jgi:hypothetical protein
MALLALPLLLIWVAGMGVWLFLDPAASQMTGGTRQTQKPGNRGLLALAPAKARTPQANLSRADHPGQRHLHASARRAKSPVAGHQPGPGRGDCAARDVASVPWQMATGRRWIVAGRRERLPATRPHDKPGDGEVHTASITAAR